MSKMKVALMLACYGASKQRIARIIGARRAAKLIKDLGDHFGGHIRYVDAQHRIYK